MGLMEVLYWNLIGASSTTLGLPSYCCLLGYTRSIPYEYRYIVNDAQYFFFFFIKETSISDKVKAIT